MCDNKSENCANNKSDLVSMMIISSHIWFMASFYNISKFIAVKEMLLRCHFQKSWFYPFYITIVWANCCTCVPTHPFKLNKALLRKNRLQRKRCLMILYPIVLLQHIIHMYNGPYKNRDKSLLTTNS